MGYRPDYYRKEIIDRLNKLGFTVVSELRKNLNRDQPYIRSGARFRGRWPSKPGEYPKKLSGALLKSIAFGVDERELSVTVGTNQRHGRYLQFGTRNMRPRPFLSLMAGYIRGVTKKLFGGQ